MHHSSIVAALVAVASLLGSVATTTFGAEPQRPNIVLIVADDQGYADVGVSGAEGFETPNLDRLARNGARFTSFYVSQGVCGASRASIMTGCYANRVSWLGAPGPGFRGGLAASEMTIAELVRQAGYATAIFGKWHLGSRIETLPAAHGFDEYYGLPYSNDMWPHHPTSNSYPDLPLIEGTTVIDPSVDADEQRRLTGAYSRRAVDFIERHRDQPFLLVVTHAMPHVPLFPSQDFVGSSAQGTYGDVIQEIDAGVGLILDSLERNSLTDRTLVIYTSDNGPWLSYGNHAGSAGPLREGKGTAWEGGVRIPCLMQMPGVIPAGLVVDEWAATIDLLPTFAELTGQPMGSLKIDGRSILPLMKGEPGATSPHEAYCYWYGTELRAIRSGPWKLVFPHQYRTLAGEPGGDGQPGPYRQEQCGLELYHLVDDIGESHDVAADNPEVVERLSELADQMRQELGDSLQGVRGNEVRPHDTFE
ncbi:MAG: sulfatase [Pirellulaceae bacterium]